MIDCSANLLGVVALAVSDRIAAAAHAALQHGGETPAALVVIGYGGGGLSNDQLRRILRLSHPGAVRLVDRLVADGLVERRKGQDKRANALHLSDRGMAVREDLLRGRLSAIQAILAPFSVDERQQLSALLRKALSAMETTAQDRRTLCRLCDERICIDCPIPADAAPEA